ncbi:hypothetical protein C8F04DRAFT_1276781 [Mycena alexandri]|uniref:Uncharacterized protein n=1 Tax=Mycena alexandri TaxID=1745969 RepID=A0AAD6WND5_9AGAR|nr:hypothetical protein C8F04DRAFT_1276781 [Mycena alexandri]
MSQSLGPITILPESKQLSDNNWNDFKEDLFSLIRGRGLGGYINGTIHPLTGPAPYPHIHPTPLNHATPSLDEYNMREGFVSSMIYQNVKDPKAHGLSASDGARAMWTTLHGKFNRTSDLLAGLAKDKLRAVKLHSGRDLPCHESWFSQPIHSLSYYPIFHTTTELQRNIPEYSWIHSTTDPE